MTDQLEVLRLLFAIGGVSFLVLFLYIGLALISKWREGDDEQW